MKQFLYRLLTMFLILLAWVAGAACIGFLFWFMFWAPGWVLVGLCVAVGIWALWKCAGEMSVDFEKFLKNKIGKK